mmetsp:Transcript_21859/g.58946  ORF Transcript_21859/g.58946 Transcript_21859/m.58946 type:complete len:621 (-) Transcript_21859:151-2013(-)
MAWRRLSLPCHGLLPFLCCASLPGVAQPVAGAAIPLMHSLAISAQLTPWWHEHPFHQPLPPHPPAPGASRHAYVTVRLAHGMNNQRQALTMGAVVARVLNRTLVVPENFAPSVHNHNPGRLDRAFDLGALQSLVPITRELPMALSAAAREGEHGVHRRVRWHAGCCDISLADVLAASASPPRPGRVAMAGTLPVFQAASGPAVLSLRPDYVYARPFFAEDLKPVVALVMRYGLRPARAPWDHASAVVDALRAHLIRQAPQAQAARARGPVLHALHMRVGDRCPYPLLECDSRIGLETRPGERERMCDWTGVNRTHEHATQSPGEAQHRRLRRDKSALAYADGGPPDTLASMLDAVALTALAVSPTPPGEHARAAARVGAFPPRVLPGDGVYVATNMWREKSVQRLTRALVNAGLSVHSWESVHQGAGGQGPGSSGEAVPRELAQDANARSLCEQLICAGADGAYFGAFPSSWDELVLHARTWLGKQGSGAQLDLFEAKARAMFHVDHLGREERARTSSLGGPNHRAATRSRAHQVDPSCHACHHEPLPDEAQARIARSAGKPRRRRASDCPPIAPRIVPRIVTGQGGVRVSAKDAVPFGADAPQSSSTYQPREYAARELR